MLYKTIGKALIPCVILVTILVLPLANAQPTPTPGYTVLGRVTYEDGSGAPDVPVVVTHQSSNEKYPGTTNETGWYIVPNVEAAAGEVVEVKASSGGFKGQGTTTASTTSPICEVHITLTESEVSPIVLVAGIICVLALIIIVALYLRGEKEPEEKTPKRRRR